MLRCTLGINQFRFVTFSRKTTSCTRFCSNNTATEVKWQTDEELNNFLALLKNNLNGTNINIKEKVKVKEKKERPQKPIKSTSYWKKEENIKLFLQKIKNKLNLKTINDWKKLTAKQITENGGGVLFHNYSMYELKCLGCPEGKDYFIKPNKPSGYWNEAQNVKNFLIDLKKKLNLKNANDWNLITNKDIKNNGGSKLLDIYSLYDLKAIGYPEGKSIFDLPKKNLGFWNNIENVQIYLLKLKEKLNLNTPNDWNSLTCKTIRENGGCGLLKHYSIYEIKCIGFPDGKSKYFYPKKSSEYWDNEDNIKTFLLQIRDEANLKTIHDWKRLSVNQIMSLGGSGLTSKLSKKEILTFVLQHQIVDDSLSSFHNLDSEIRGRSTQRWLFLQVQKLFPGEEIVEDYFHSEISRKSGLNVQLDIFLIHKNIAFEYHGKQHYEDIPSAFAPVELYKFRDREKEKLCKEYGIHLIIIPYWWDNTVDSLKETIQSSLPPES